MLKESRRKERRQFKFLNVKLLHNQSTDNYVGLFMKLLEADYVVDTSNNRQVELLDFVMSQTKGVYVGKIATYMRSSNVKWFDNETKQRTIGPQISENLRPNLKEDFFYLVPERHRIAIPSSSEVSINSLKQYLDMACFRLMGPDQVSTSIEIDPSYVKDIKTAVEVSRIEVTWSYTNKDYEEGLAKVLDDSAKNGNAARITTIITSAPGESLFIKDESLPGALLNLAQSNSTGEAEATVKNPEYNKKGKRIKENRKNISTSNYPLKEVIAFSAGFLTGAIYDFVMSKFRQG